VAEAPEPSDADEPIRRLLALQTPPASPLTVAVRAEPAGGGLRDIEAAPAGERPFRLGDWMRFVFETNRPCHVTLIDVGTSGTVAVLWPNRWQPDARLEAGRPYVVPAPERSAFGFRLSGRPGGECVVCLATLAPLSSLPPLPSGADFRKLAPEDTGRLLDAVAALDPATWAVGHCPFTIEP
jgi:hypothetical protein